MIAVPGMIAMFWGLLANIPAGWKSCDGTASTPDLRDRFILGAGFLLPPHLTGGDLSHNHDFTTDGHLHTLPFGDDIESGPIWSMETDSKAVSGTTDNAALLPPYYALIFVQKT